MELKDRAKHERDFAAAFAKLTGKQRRELTKLAGTPPDLNLIPPAQWRKWEDEQREALAVALLLIYDLTSRQHGVGNDGAYAMGLAYANDRANRVASLFTAHTIDGLRQGRDLDYLLGPTRATGVAVNEVTGARSKAIIDATEAVAEDVITDDGDIVPRSERAVLIWTLDFVRDTKEHCYVCPMMEGTEESFWRQFFKNGPPIHFGCACGLAVHPPGTKGRKPSHGSSAVVDAARRAGAWGY